MPELNGPPATIATPRSTQRGSRAAQRRLVGERIAAGEQDHVQVGDRQRVEADLHVVDAETVRRERALGLAPRERRQRAFHHLAEARRLLGAVRCDVDVVDVGDVDARQAEARRLSSSERSVPSYE